MRTGCLLTSHHKQEMGFPDSSVGKDSACNAGDLGLIPGLGRSSGEGNGYLLQYSCLGNPTDRRAWKVTVHGVAESQTQLSDWTTKHYRIQDCGKGRWELSEQVTFKGTICASHPSGWLWVYTGHLRVLPLTWAVEAPTSRRGHGHHSHTHTLCWPPINRGPWGPPALPGPAQPWFTEHALHWTD